MKVLGYTLALVSLGYVRGEYLDPKICSFSEPCRFEVAGFPLTTFCGCGEGKECQKKTINFEGVNYAFCQDIAFPVCEREDVSVVKFGLRQVFQCQCPKPYSLVSQNWGSEEDVTEYVCDMKKECEAEAEREGVKLGEVSCKEREHVWRANNKRISNLREICTCPPRSRCVESMDHQDLPAEDGHRKDLFFCQGAGIN